MNNILIFFVLTLLCVCCNSSDNEKAKKAENIAWVNTLNLNNPRNYIEFIVEYPNSEKIDSALNNYFTSRDSLWAIDWVGCDCFANCASVKILNSDTVIFEDFPVSIDSLRKKSLEFLVGDFEQENKPEKIQIKDLDGIERMSSKAYFELSYVKDSCKNLHEAIKEISMALHDYRDVLSIEWYNEKSENIDINKLKFIETYSYYRIVIYRWDETLNIKPPMRNEHINIE